MSAVVPCRNERDAIESCVRSILGQQPPAGGFELIVVDGMSDDGTREILSALAANEPALRIVDNPRQITPCAMNAGIRHARGRYVAIMGAHNRYAPDYLQRAVEVLEITGADNVGGAMLCDPGSLMERAISTAHHSSFSVGGARWHNPHYEGPADTVFGGVYRREVFDRIGLFDEQLVRNQDDELNLRLTRAGGKIWQSPSIKSWYRPRSSLRALWRQYQQYGYWKVKVLQKHKIPASFRQLVPGIFVFSLAVLPLLSFWNSACALVWAALVVLYACGNLTAALVLAARHGWELLPILPAVFASYHFSYGVGFLRGIWDFALLGRAADPAYAKLNRR